ncbi:MAG: glycosyltransferase family 2 protein, partial [Planctomycetaceae bacterium]|nr:glycosyltransferase family 2 protein [Planctomycetaceae bacterium]
MTERRISVILPTRNPNRERLAEVMRGLSQQTLARTLWDVCIVDNGSTPPLEIQMMDLGFDVQVIAEMRPGLLWARLAGIKQTAGDLMVFIDDDTIPDRNFLSESVAFMDTYPALGTAGGRIGPRYLVTPPPWIDSIEWLLAIRDNGSEPLFWGQSDGTALPSWTPIGAGLLVRRAAIDAEYLTHVRDNSSHIEEISW